MQERLVELLRCPLCRGANAFDLSVRDRDAFEIVSGELKCRSCSGRFPVRDGYANLLAHPSVDVQLEQAAQARAEKAAVKTHGLPEDPAEREAYILGLPSGHAHSEEHWPLVEYALDQLELNPGTTVLDLGAGISWTTALFARRGCHAIALDIYGNILACTRVFVAQNVYFDRILADMTALPLVNGGIDVVFANAAIHHSPNISRTAQEVSRVLKPGGRVVFVNEPVVGLFERSRRARFGQEEKDEGFNERIYTVREWRSAFVNASLQPKFEIPEAGVAEKIARRREFPAYRQFPRSLLLQLVEKEGVRKRALKFLKTAILYISPFNVVIWGRK